MFFKNFFNWLKYTTVTPSFYFKNRLFLEKSFKSNHVYSFLGETHKSFSWLKLSSTNLATIWFRTSRRRFLIVIMLVLVVNYTLFINSNDTYLIYGSPIVHYLFFTLWRLLDIVIFILLQLHFMALSTLITLVINFTGGAFLQTLTLNRWLHKRHAGIILNNRPIAVLPHSMRISDLGYQYSTELLDVEGLFKSKSYDPRQEVFLKRLYLAVSFLTKGGVDTGCFRNKNYSDPNLNLFVRQRWTSKSTASCNLNDRYTLKSLMSKEDFNAVNFATLHPKVGPNNPLNYKLLSDNYSGLYRFIKTNRNLYKNVTVGSNELINLNGMLSNIVSANSNKGAHTSNKLLSSSVEWLLFKDNFLTNSNVNLKQYKGLGTAVANQIPNSSVNVSNLAFCNDVRGLSIILYDGARTPNTTLGKKTTGFNQHRSVTFVNYTLNKSFISIMQGSNQYLRQTGFKNKHPSAVPSKGTVRRML